MDSHRQCLAAQFKIGCDHENKRKFIKYTPRLSKNVQGALKHRRIEIVPIKRYEDKLTFLKMMIYCLEKLRKHLMLE